MALAPPDFNRLLAADARLDFGFFRAGCVVTVRILASGTQLRLPTGRLVAGEPWAGFGGEAGAYAFVQEVAPGTYPVELVLADFHDPGNPQGNFEFSGVAAARLVIREEPVVRWRMALQPGNDEASLGPHEFFGYPVDGGIGAFGSPEVFDRLDETDSSGEDLFDLSMKLFKGDEVVEYVDQATGHNLVMFASGDGDGHYATWVGYTGDGEIACFLTDFLTLTAQDEQDEEDREDDEDDEDRDGNPSAAASAAPSHPLSGPASHGSGSQLFVGQTLRRQSLTSQSGACTLAHQDDGNLVLYRYDRDRAVWASHTQGRSVGELILQEDGNLVLYDRDGRAVWATGTDGRAAARLTLRDDAVAVLESVSGEVLWSTGPLEAGR
jgi:hypothetical protein